MEYRPRCSGQILPTHCRIVRPSPRRAVPQVMSKLQRVLISIQIHI